MENTILTQTNTSPLLVLVTELQSLITSTFDKHPYDTPEFYEENEKVGEMIDTSLSYLSPLQREEVEHFMYEADFGKAGLEAPYDSIDNFTEYVITLAPF